MAKRRKRDKKILEKSIFVVVVVVVSCLVGDCGKISVGKWGRPFLFRGAFGSFFYWFWKLGVVMFCMKSFPCVV